MHDANRQTTIDLAAARHATTINVEAIGAFLHDGNWEVHRGVVEIMSADPAFDKSKRAFMTRSERYKRALAMTHRVYQLKDIHKWTSAQCDLAIRLLDEPVPISLHAVAFEPIFNALASPSLLAIYSPLIKSRGILGCYLQTELAHGSSLTHLETAATYLPSSQEFELHSPTMTSAKWWIGALGKTCTHGVVQAKLVVGGRDEGAHLFFVQLRSLEDHTVLPGITIGDIGPKALGGFAPLDNGYALFSHVRIPRSHMLSRFAHVTEDGRYVKGRSGNEKESYGGMLYIRSGMVTSGGWMIAKAATISIRYATVRRQGGVKNPNELERQVITYPSTYYRLLPILSHAYVFILLGREITTQFRQFSASSSSTHLPELHALTSSLKVLVTTMGIKDLQDARRSMGGHGYSEWAGVGRLEAEWAPSVTYEGDNFLLDKQVVRAALKVYRRLLAASSSATSTSTPTAPPLTASSYYLRLLPPLSSPPTPLTPNWSYSQTSIDLLEWRAALLVKDLSMHHKGFGLGGGGSEGQGDEEEDLDASVYQRVSKAVSEAYVGRWVGEMIERMDVGKGAVRDLFRLYLLTTIEAALVDLLSFNLLSSLPTDDPARALRMTIKSICISLLPNAVGLSDAFGFTDWELHSALGVYDGNVYEELWKYTQTEPLNQTEVPDGYEEYIKPILVRGCRLNGVKL